VLVPGSADQGMSLSEETDFRGLEPGQEIPEDWGN
jgi:hypothetical protein